MRAIARLKKINFNEAIPRIVLGVIAFLTVGLLVGIFLFLFFSGYAAIKDIGLKTLLFGTVWNPIAYGHPSWGALPLILGTLLVTATALLIAVPLGIASAIYISEIVSPRFREILKPAIEMIASVPSVVLGLLGLLFLAPFIAKVFHLSNGLNALTAGILVAIAALPTIASICEDTLRAVPQKYRQSSLALGATQWTTIKRVVLPAAKSGLLAAIMLGLGRIIGETMIVLMVAGNSSAVPHSFLDPVRPMTANIAIEIKETVVGSLHWESLFAIGLGLFVITFVVNFLADLLIHRNEIR
jgi:phosphate transport system permease protein